MTAFPKPLAGKRIIDLSLFLPGPYAGMLLHSFGAEIIRLEPPDGDPVLRMSPDLHRILHRGKTIERVDLKTPQGQARLASLLDGADALIEGFRPGVLARLGFAPERLRREYPGLVIASISGYGATGPYRDHPAHDMSVLGVAGYFSLPSELSDPIARPNIRLADVLCAQSAALSILAAMVQADKTGQGCVVDTSIFEATAAPVLLSLLARDDADAPPEQIGLVMADSAPYRCAGGGYVCIATLEDKYWAGFVDCATPADSPLRDPAYRTRAGRDADKPGLARLLADLFLTKPREYWAELADQHTLPITPMWRGKELLSDPQMQARQLVRQGCDEHGAFDIPTYPAAFDGVRE